MFPQLIFENLEPADLNGWVVVVKSFSKRLIIPAMILTPFNSLITPD